MDQKKIDKIISFIREEMSAGAVTPTNHTGPNVAEFSPLMGKLMKRKRPEILAKGKLPGARKRWKNGWKKGESK